MLFSYPEYKIPFLRPFALIVFDCAFYINKFYTIKMKCKFMKQNSKSNIDRNERIKSNKKSKKKVFLSNLFGYTPGIFFWHH